jgi:hypothetical protein
MCSSSISISIRYPAITQVLHLRLEIMEYVMLKQIKKYLSLQLRYNMQVFHKPVSPKLYPKKRLEKFVYVHKITEEKRLGAK